MALPADSNEMVCQLEQRYNSPPTALKPELAYLCEQYSDPRTFWTELLNRSYLSRDFSEDGHRTFGFQSNDEVVWPSSRPHECAFPSSKLVMLTIANDPDGILKAEFWSQRLAYLLQPWGAAAVKGMTWYVTDNQYEATYMGSPYEFAIDTMTCTLDEYGIDFFDLIPASNETCLPFLVRRTLAAEKAWRLASANRLEIAPPTWIELDKHLKFDDLDSPFDAILQVWLTGYRVLSEFSLSDSTLRLYARPVLCENEILG